jgi:hypothetical protein
MVHGYVQLDTHWANGLMGRWPVALCHTATSLRSSRVTLDFGKAQITYLLLGW